MSLQDEKVEVLPAVSWNRPQAMQALLYAIVFSADAMIIFGTSFATGIGYHLFAYDHVGNLNHYLTLGFLAAVLFVVPAIYQGTYTFEAHRRPARIGRWVLVTWSIVFATIFVLGFLTKSTEIYSRGWLLLFYVTGVVVLVSGKFAVSQLISFAITKKIISAQRAILVGTPEYVDKFIQILKMQGSQVDILSVFYLSSEQMVDEVLTNVMRSARGLAPDCIYIAVPLKNSTLISLCLDRFTVLPLSLHLVSNGVLSRFRRIEFTKIGDFMSLRVLRPPLSILALVLKRSFDFFGSLVLLIVLAPVMLLAALAIKLEDGGPVLFRQKRFGFTQRSFHILKLRTMKISETSAPVVQARQNDERITRVGTFLRRTNIDELPQLLNVLWGQMSLVGPRPHALVHDHQFEKQIAVYAQRQKVKPGITGWAQVSGFRGPTDTYEKIKHRVEYDIYYIENWSLLFDIKILLLTVFSQKAYRNAG